MDDWSIDTSELDVLVGKLDQTAANLEHTAHRVIDATYPMIKSEMSKHMKESKKIRLARVNRRTGRLRDKWRTGIHAKYEIEVSRPKLSLRGSIYKIVGPSTGDNSPHFYMKFFETGRGIYNRKSGQIEGHQEPRSYVEPTVSAVRDPVIEKMKEVLKKELDLYD